MALDAYPVKTKKHSAIVITGVYTVLKTLHSPESKQSSKFCPDRGHKRFPDKVPAEHPHPFRNLQGDITSKTVCYDDINCAKRYIITFNITTEIPGEIQLVQNSGRSLDAFLAF